AATTRPRSAQLPRQQSADGRPHMIRLLCAALVFGATVIAAAAETLPFEVTLPAGVKTVKQAGPDFDVYYFNLNNKTLAGAYFGWAPQFDIQRTSSSDGRPIGPVQQTVACTNGAVVRREVLLVVPEGSDGQTYIHAWTVEGADRTLAEAILTSIHVPKKND